jgi:hypothetical protein
MARDSFSRFALICGRDARSPSKSLDRALGLTSFAAVPIVSLVNVYHNHEQRLLLLLLSLHLLRLVSGRDREGFGRREEQMIK